MKLGMHDPTHDDRDLLLDYYLVASKLPPIPDVFGHSHIFPKAEWGMLGNDHAGDCAIAGPAHETMVWTRLGGKRAYFSDAVVLSDYSAITGYDPADPSTDRGSNVRDVANYRRKVGLLDVNGQRHKIGAYVGLTPGHREHVTAAAYLFDGVGIGINVPDTAQEQFHAGRPWDLVPGSQIVGGHYIPVFDVNEVGPVCVTWGAPQQMTWRFYEAQCTLAYAYLSAEQLKDGLTTEGFNATQLQEDLAAVRS